MKNRFSKSFTLSPGKILFGFAGILFVCILIAAALAIPNSQASTQDNIQSADKVWQFTEESTIGATGTRQIIPQTYRTVQLKQDTLGQLLGKAPLEFTQEAKESKVTLALPLPDGTFAAFHIEDSPIMEAGLAAQYPEIKTYRGQGIDDPTATVRFDVTPAGFHAMILSKQGTIYIDPYAKDDATNYITYYKADYRNDAKPFQCYFENVNQPVKSSNQSVVPYVANGATLRTYRLALAATGEYTATKGGTVSAALAAMTTTMNRVNGVYERDIAVRMILIANNNLIIYTNSSTDPYSNNDGLAMLSQNQSNVDSVIGTSNYDIGHVFSTGGGGVASLGVVCSSSSKARGVTGSPTPVGDGFDIDYVAHEIGHQFGANHTFNGSQGSCGGNRSTNAAYETGSGSTIMAYAGICGAQDLQPHSDDYFHVRSLEEISAFIATTSCDVETSTGNTLPSVSTGSTVTIPRGTPFTLTATANDVNGDALTYCWEEYDLGPASPPDTDADGNARPIFRSFNPTTNSSRTFPKLSDVLNNTSTYGEALPAISRTMNFQVTVRDNRSGGGSINTATQQVIVSAGAGPFLVTQPDTAVSWTGGTQQTVIWNVANTSAAPVNTANVRILLSTNGGNTFPTVLVASTPNDGTQLITVPNTPTSTARIKVEAVGNIFFDLSNANFTITAAPVLRTLTVASSNPASGVAITVSPNDNNGFGNGTTQFTRTYNNNTVVSLTAPATVSGKNFQKWQRNGVDFAVTQATNVTMDANHTMTAVYITPGPVYQGFHDGADCSQIWGWAWDANLPNTPINVDIYDGSTLITTVAANLFRQDLLNAGKGNGFHAFVYNVPASLKNGQVHSISVKFSGTNTLLSSSPRSIACDASLFPSPSGTIIAVSGAGQTWEQSIQFSSSISGRITHIRFYKVAGESNGHVGRIWSDSGTQLAQVTFTSETASGWQEKALSTPLQITAGVKYRVSYNVNLFGAKIVSGMSSPIISGPLTAWGAFYTTPSGTFPNTGSVSNFLADIKFSAP
jgi:hypothetical protein